MSSVQQKTNTEEVETGFLPHFLEKGLVKVMDFGHEPAKNDSVEERLEKGTVKYTSKENRRVHANNVIPLNSIEARVAAHVDTDTEKERLAMEIAKKNETNQPILAVSNEAGNIVSVLNDEKKLEKLNNDAEKLEKYFDKQDVVDTLTPEERKEKFNAFINHYTEKEEDIEGQDIGHRKMKSFWAIVKSNWRNRKGFLSFFWKSGKDYFGHRAVRRGLESYNAGVDLKNKYEKDIEVGVAAVEEGADKVKIGLNAKKEAKMNASGLYLLGLSSIKNFITLPTKKNRTAVMKFVEKYPKEGAKVFKDLGMPLKGIARQARKTEAFARIFDWIFHPESYNDGFLKNAGNIALDVAPITSSYRDIKELFNDESEYSFGTRALFAGTSVAMDIVWGVGTFFSVGAASAPLAAARVGARVAMKGGAKKIAGSGVMKGALKSIPKMNFMEYVKKMPSSARRHVLGKESAFLALFLLGDNAASYFWEKYNPLLKSYTMAAAKNVAMEKMTPEQVKMMHFAQRNLI